VQCIVRGGRLRGSDELVDIGIDGGRIVAIEPRIDGVADREVDAAGSLVVPGFVDGHMHLDKCMLGDVMRPNRAQTLHEAIEITNEHKRSYDQAEIVSRATQVLDMALVNGTIAMRGFADVGTVGGLTPLKALLELRDRYAGRITLQVVAFPQEGISRDPGADRLLEQAMDLGADVVGGLPWYERTDAEVQQHVDFCFNLAARYDKDVHFLADDTDDAYSRSLEALAVSALAHGYEGRVVASHCGALAAYDHTHAEKVIALVKEAGVTISSNSHISLVLGGRSDRGLVRRGITRTKELVQAGVNVIASQDDVNDPYYPFGRSDQMEVAQYMAHAAHLTYPSELEDVLDMVTVNAARALRLEGYGTGVGDRADLVVLGAPSVAQSQRLLPPRRYVLHAGEVVVENRVDTVVTPRTQSV
jgi:cytosine deaminase